MADIFKSKSLRDLPDNFESIYCPQQFHTQYGEDKFRRHTRYLTDEVIGLLQGLDDKKCGSGPGYFSNLPSDGIALNSADTAEGVRYDCEVTGDFSGADLDKIILASGPEISLIQQAPYSISQFAIALQNYLNSHGGGLVSVTTGLPGGEKIEIERAYVEISEFGKQAGGANVPLSCSPIAANGAIFNIEGTTYQYVRIVVDRGANGSYDYIGPWSASSGGTVSLDPADYTTKDGDLILIQGSDNGTIPQAEKRFYIPDCANLIISNDLSNPSNVQINITGKTDGNPPLYQIDVLDEYGQDAGISQTVNPASNNQTVYLDLSSLDLSKSFAVKVIAAYTTSEPWGIPFGGVISEMHPCVVYKNIEKCLYGPAIGDMTMGGTFQVGGQNNCQIIFPS